MKKIVSIAVLLGAVMTLILAGCSDSSGQKTEQAKSDVLTSFRKTVVKTVSVASVKKDSMEGAHESDDLLYQSTNMLVFVNMTSPEMDTLYVVKFKIGKAKTETTVKTKEADTASTQQCKGTTKKGARCKSKTKDPSGFCRMHKK